MIYFVSDAHLGSLLIEDPKAHERKLVEWLDKIKSDAKAIFLLGDMFDFWFEYKSVVPKGYVRFLGKLAECVDAGIEVHFFIGNHDLWTFGYLEKEIGMIVHREPITIELGNKKFYLAHGDGLTNGDTAFKFLRKIFHSKMAHKVFRCIPPRLGQKWGYAWSKQSRLKHSGDACKYKGEHNENLIIYAKHYAEKHDVDFIIFGHRHLALDLQIRNNKRVVLLGDFISIFSYGVFDGENFYLDYVE